MRRMLWIVAATVVLAELVGAAVFLWRRDPRVGASFVNSVIDPTLLRRGLAGGAVSELGILEHIGRRSGIRRLTPLHPEPTPEGFRIVVPLGPKSEWARNVVAAGHCRLQLHDRVYELDEPALIPAGQADHLPRAVRAVMAALGFQYLTLRTFGAQPGALGPMETAAPRPDRPEPTEASVTPVPGEPVSLTR